MTRYRSFSSAFVAWLVLAIFTSSSSAFTSRPHTTTTHSRTQFLVQLSTSSPDDPSTTAKPILCELQTFLRLLNLDEIPTGGAAKVVIQGGDVLLNGQVETRRAKKLFSGDKVQLNFEGIDETFDVSAQVALRGYVFKDKKKNKKQKKEEVITRDSLNWEE